MSSLQITNQVESIELVQVTNQAPSSIALTSQRHWSQYCKESPRHVEKKMQIPTKGPKTKSQQNKPHWSHGWKRSTDPYSFKALALPQPVILPNASEEHQALWEGLAAEARHWLLKLLSGCYAIRSCRSILHSQVWGSFRMWNKKGSFSGGWRYPLPTHKSKGIKSHQSGNSWGKSHEITIQSYICHFGNWIFLKPRYTSLGSSAWRLRNRGSGCILNSSSICTLKILAKWSALRTCKYIFGILRIVPLSTSMNLLRNARSGTNLTFSCEMCGLIASMMFSTCRHAEDFSPWVFNGGGPTDAAGGIKWLSYLQPRSMHWGFHSPRPPAACASVRPTFGASAAKLAPMHAHDCKRRL